MECVLYFLIEFYLSRGQGAWPVLHISVLVMNNTTESAIFIYLVYSLLPNDPIIQNLFVRTQLKRLLIFIRIPRHRSFNFRYTNDIKIWILIKLFYHFEDLSLSKNSVASLTTRTGFDPILLKRLQNPKSNKNKPRLQRMKFQKSRMRSHSR